MEDKNAEQSAVTLESNISHCNICPKIEQNVEHKQAQGKCDLKLCTHFFLWGKTGCCGTGCYNGVTRPVTWPEIRRNSYE